MEKNEVKKDNSQYWRKNLLLLGGLLTLWFISSYVCGILLVDQLNQLKIGGVKLGFWFAQQGSIIIFLGIIIYYVYAMNKLDKKYGVEEE